MKRFLVMLIATLSLAACSPDPTVDTSSEAAMNESFVEIMKYVDADERTQFKNAIITIMFADFSHLADIVPLGRNEAAFRAEIIHGKNFKEILELANEIRAREIKAKKGSSTEEKPPAGSR